MKIAIHFGSPGEVAETEGDVLECVFPFTVSERAEEHDKSEQNRDRNFEMMACITVSRLNDWDIPLTGARKLLFEFTKREVTRLARYYQLPQRQKLRLPTISTVSHPFSRCPFDIGELSEPAPVIITIEEYEPTLFTNLSAGQGNGSE